MIQTPGPLNATVQALTLSKGLHLITVTAASPQRSGDDDDMALPAIHVGPGPGVPAGQVEILSGPRHHGPWLSETRDMLVLKVATGQALILLTTIRGVPGPLPTISVEVRRLDGRPGAEPAPQSPPPPPPALPPAAATAPGLKTPSGRAALSTRMDLHISRKGDVFYVNNYWAGALGERLAIEAFAITPLEGLLPDQIEYYAVAASGAETGWVEGGRLCGSRGAMAPLAGFAVRVKGEVASEFECEYRGSFSSGRIVGPVRDGALCASEPGDRLEAIQLFMLKREAVDLPPVLMLADQAPSPEPDSEAPSRKVGPRFSVFRETLE
jgi:hypothetical protein